MKTKYLLFFLPFMLLIIGCDQSQTNADVLEGAFSVSMPEPTKAIDSVELTTAQQTLSKALNTFGFNLTEKLYTDKSIIVSPLSLYLALSMVEAGAEGETAGEIASVLGGDAQQVKAYSKSLLEQLPAVDLDVKVRLADALVVNNQYKLKSDYKSIVEGYYYAPVENLSFANRDAVLKRINDWSFKNTNGLIPTILDTIEDNDVAFLLNALYFKGTWAMPYTDGQVRQKDFFGLTKKLDYLTEVGYGNYADGGNYHIASREYGNGKYRFYILVPKEANGLKTMLASLKKVQWRNLVAGMTTQYINLQFPKFETESRFDLKETLMALGIQKAFTSNAEFNTMFEGESVQVGKVIQKSKIKLDEFGTEAAAVTVVAMETGMGPGETSPIEVIADHPFAYVIAESTSNTILFTGVFDGR